MPPKGRKKAAAVGYEHTAAVPNGTVLTSLNKKQWIVRNPVGQGGFGVLYLATPAEKPGAEPSYVLKLEPHSNGPLFCEMHFYLRCAKPEMIKTWLKAKKRKSVGIPKYIGHGAHEHHGENRFLVMERFGTDLQNLFVKAGKRFQQHTVYKVAVKMIDALEYIHSKDYVHADIKAANILLGHDNSDEVYLVDYGLASRYTLNDTHIEYKPDPKCCHNGTIEFTSRDAHDGVPPSRRSDMEILGYCLVQWLCSRLPWEDRLTNKIYVKTQKNEAMDNIPAFMKKCFGADVPTELQTYMENVASLLYTTEPDYDGLRKLFNAWLKKSGQHGSGLDFNGSRTVNGHASSSKNHGDLSSIDDFKPSPPGQKRPRKATSSSKKATKDATVTPRGKRSKTDDNSSPSPAKKGRDESLGVGPLLSVEDFEVRPRRSPRNGKRVNEIVTKDVYSPPARLLTVPKRGPCKNPVDVAIQTSPWLKKTIRRPPKKKAPE